MYLEELEKLMNSYTVKLDRSFFSWKFTERNNLTSCGVTQYKSTVLYNCVIFFVKTVWIADGRLAYWGGGGGGQNSCLALVVIYEFDLRHCCSSETSVNTFWLVDVFLQAPSGTLLSQDEIDQILQIWTSMQRQIVSLTTMIVINEEIIAVKTQL